MGEASGGDVIDGLETRGLELCIPFDARILGHPWLDLVGIKASTWDGSVAPGRWGLA